MGVGSGLYMYDVVLKRWRSLSHLLMSSCFSFNVSKCKVMHTGPRNTNCSYFANGQLLNSVTEHKDLWMIISNNLKVDDHCHYACNKANKMLAMIKRTIKHTNISVMVQLYKSLVRPHLKYCSPVWSPYYSKDKVMLESAQHRFTRLFPALRAMSYEARLEILWLWSLEERRNRLDLIEVYKMIHGFTDVPLSTFLANVTTLRSLYAIAIPSVCRLSYVCLWRWCALLSRLKFSAFFHRTIAQGL